MTTDLSTAVHPLSDPDFGNESQRSRDHILRWWDIVTAIAAAPDRKRSLAMFEIKSSAGIGFRTIRRMFYQWLSGKAHKTRYPAMDWRALANRRDFRNPMEARLPAAFVAWVKKQNELHQRATSFKQAYREVLAALELWERCPHDPAFKIPGYDTPPARNPFKGVPEGWSETNLRYHCRSNDYEKALRRQGPKRASEFLPSVRTSREGLEFGEIIYFDDQVHDTFINFTGVNDREMRPQSFNALEALSAMCFEIGLKPQIWDSENKVRRELDALDFFWFVMLVLTKHGYNAKAGTTLIWEHGKANPDKTGQFDLAIEKVTNGAVRVDKSGIFRAPAFKAMLFEGQPSGNFRFKTALESFFSILRTYSDNTALLPAPTGRNRDLAPEESYGLLAENKRLLGLLGKVPDEIFTRLKRPVLEWEDYCWIHQLAMRAINNRREHSLQGWNKLGFTGARYRLGHDKPWIDEQDYQLIPATERALYDHIVRQPGNNELFQLSPAEVFKMRHCQLTRLPMRVVPILAPERAWSDVTVSQSLEMTICDQWLDSEPLYFIATVRTEQGYDVHLERGKTYKRLLNIFDPTRMWIAEREGSRRGAIIGTATRVHVACKTNHEAILQQLGNINHVKAAENAEVHARMQTEADRRIAARRFNTDLTTGKLLTPEDRAAERTKRSAARLGEIMHDISEGRVSSKESQEIPITPDSSQPEVEEW